MASDPAEMAVRNYLASPGNPDTFRQGFVEHAKAWAEAQGIPPGAFEQMGVSHDVLEAAGIVETVVCVGQGAPSSRHRRPVGERSIFAFAEPGFHSGAPGNVGAGSLPREAEVCLLEGQKSLVPDCDR